MNRLIRLRAERELDEGSALVFALIVVMFVGITIAALLSFAGTGLAIAPKERALRNQTNYVSGAVDAAVNRIRNSSFEGVNDSSFDCPDLLPGSPAEATAQGAGNGVSYKVTCTPKGGTSLANSDRPLFAIQTLGTSGSDGINQKKDAGNNLLTIDGPIFSNNLLKVEAGSGNSHNIMQVKGSAYALASAPTNCNTTLVTTLDNGGLPHCNFTDTHHIGADPEYSAAVPNQPALDALIADPNAGADPQPSCSTNSNVVEFTPGYYGEKPGDLLPTGCAAANLWHFSPGKYVFDYTGIWDLGSPHAVTVIGGTPKGDWTTSGVAPPNGDGCEPSAAGVQFEFVGASQLAVTSAGGIELCAPTQAQSFPGAPQRISLVAFQHSSTNTQGTATPVTNTLTATSAPTVPNNSTTWVQPEGAQTIGAGDGAPATSAPAFGQTASLAYSGFQNAPKGSNFSKLYVRLAQTIANVTDSINVVTQSTGAAGQDFSIGGPGGGGTPCAGTQMYCVDISSVLQTPSWRDANSLSLTYNATGNKNGTPGAVSMDGIELVATYQTPTLTDITCTTGCTFFNSSVNLNVFFHGSVYAPSAKLDIEVSNQTGTIFHRGVISRTIDIHVNASSKQEGSPFRLPASSPVDRVVLLTGWVDDGSGFQPRVRACVSFQDFFTTSAGDSAFPGYKVNVKHWDVQSPTAVVPNCS